MEVAEWRALLGCAQVSPDGGRLPDLDWPKFVAAAARHRIIPLVYRRLRGIAELRGRMAAVVQRNAVLAAETAKLAQILPCIAFKGAVSAVQIYGDPDLREYGDIDLLIAERDRAAARDALQSLGYRAA